ncbi:MAG: hypothetical protein IJ575_05845 [Selenomonadaceae bacterium]|nr:hypothetical protein [Selenomonadaceae bacterium]
MLKIIPILAILFSICQNCFAMNFSAPVRMGEIFNTPSGGFVFSGDIYNQGELYKRFSKWQGENVYGKGVARFGNGDDALYFYYDEARPYGKDSNGRGYNSKFGDSNGTNLFSTEIIEYSYLVDRIDTDSNFTFYVLVRSGFGVSFTNYIIIGKQKNGKFTKYFETDDIRQQHFGKARSIFFDKLICKSDTIVVTYKSNYVQGISDGEFRFKWDDAAQWFSVEHVQF